MSQQKNETREEYLIRGRAYRARPEVKAREAEKRATSKHKTYQAIYRSDPVHKSRAVVLAGKPEYRARAFDRRNHLPAGTSLPWFLIPQSERACFFCGEPPQGKMALDHDHGTAKIRGWSHEMCNTAEGTIGAAPNPGTLLRFLVAMHAQPNPLTGLFSGADRPHIV